jgi:CHASE3 domain sensor protein
MSVSRTKRHKMSEEQIVKLLEEIRDLQHQQLQLSKENNQRYKEALKASEKYGRRQRVALIVFLILMLAVFVLLIYAEWFADGIPKPSWVK